MHLSPLDRVVQEKIAMAISTVQDLELKLTADRVLVFDWIAGSSQMITLGEEEGVRAKEKFRAH